VHAPIPSGDVTAIARVRAAAGKLLEA